MFGTWENIDHCGKDPRVAPLRVLALRNDLSRVLARIMQPILLGIAFILLSQTDSARARRWLRPNDHSDVSSARMSSPDPTEGLPFASGAYRFIKGVFVFSY
jgi:hypothetical protein